MYAIGKVAAHVDISTNALRYYEREGLIHRRLAIPGGVMEFWNRG